MNEYELNFENYRSNINRIKIVLYSYYVAFILCAATILVGLYYYFELKKYLAVEVEDVTIIEMIYNIFTILHALLTIVTMVTFAFWFRRAYANLERLGVNIEYKNYWAVWSFIIPIISLFRPLKIAKEIDIKYESVLEQFNDLHKKNDNSYSILKAWFIVYWIDILIYRILDRTTDHINNVLENLMYSLISALITLISIGLTILMIRTLSKSEIDLEQYLKLEELNSNT